MVVGLLGNENPNLNRFTLVTPKPANGVRLQATLDNQNPTGLPVGAVSGILLLILLLIRVLIRTRKKGREGRYSRYDQALLYMKKTDILKNNKKGNSTKN